MRLKHDKALCQRNRPVRGTLDTHLVPSPLIRVAARVHVRVVRGVTGQRPRRKRPAWGGAGDPRVMVHGYRRANVGRVVGVGDVKEGRERGRGNVSS